MIYKSKDCFFGFFDKVRNYSNRPFTLVFIRPFKALSNPRTLTLIKLEKAWSKTLHP